MAKTQTEWMDDLKQAEASGNYERANKIRSHFDMPTFNLEGEGAPTGVRASVGASRGPGAQLQALQGFYPGARPVGGDNFAFESAPGELSLYNQPGLDLGDIAEHGRIPAEMGGAAIGGFLGTPGLIPGIAAGAAAGGTLAGQLYDKGMQYFGGAQDTRSMGDAAGDIAFDAAANATGGAIPRWLGMPSQTARRGMAPPIRAAAPSQLDQVLEETGVGPMTMGQRDPTGNMAALEAGLQGTVTGRGAINQQRTGILDRLDEYVQEQFPRLHSREEAGGLLAQGAQDRVGVRSKITGQYPQESLRGQVKQLYQRLDDILFAEGASTGGKIDLPAGRQLLQEIETKAARDGEYAQLVNRDPDLRRYLDTLRSALQEAPAELQPVPGQPRILDAGGEFLTPQAMEVVPGTGSVAEYPSYDLIKEFRSGVGAKIDDPFTTATGTNQRDVKRLYGVLSDDMQAGVHQIGGEAASKAADRASWFNKALMTRLEKVDKVFKNAENPTQVFTAMETMVKGNPSGLRAVKKTVPRAAWDDFADTYIRRIIDAKPGNSSQTGRLFVPGTAGTALNKLADESPEAWDILTEGRGNALNNLRYLANHLKQSEGLFNTSGTGRVADIVGNTGAVGTGALAGGLTGDVATGAAVAGTSMLAKTVFPWLASKVVTSPKFGKVFGAIDQADLGAVRNATDLARLFAAAGADRDMVEQIKYADGNAEE